MKRIHSSLQSEEDAIQKKLSVQLCGGTNAAERPSYMLIRSMLIGPNGLPLIRLSLCSASIAKVLWSSFWPAVWSDCMVVFDCSDLQQLQLSTCSVMALLMPNSYIECSCTKCSYIKRSSTKLSGCHPEDGQHIAVPLLMSLAVLLHLPKPSQNLGSIFLSKRRLFLDGVSVFISSLEAPAAVGSLTDEELPLKESNQQKNRANWWAVLWSTLGCNSSDVIAPIWKYMQWNYVQCASDEHQSDVLTLGPRCSSRFLSFACLSYRIGIHWV